jgi:hypothetical protein
MTSVDTSQLIISTCHFPKEANVALDVIGRWAAQLFHHTIPGLVPLESGKCSCLSITSRLTTSTTEKQKEQHIQPIGNKDDCGNCVNKILIGQMFRIAACDN